MSDAAQFGGSSTSGVFTSATVREGRGNGLQPRHVLLRIVPPRPELRRWEAREVGRVEPVTQRDDATDPVRTMILRIS